jgi:hypothetical protein
MSKVTVVACRANISREWFGHILFKIAATFF